jgi:hypothetical protein
MSCTNCESGVRQDKNKTFYTKQDFSSQYQQQPDKFIARTPPVLWSLFRDYPDWQFFSSYQPVGLDIVSTYYRLADNQWKYIRRY